MPSFISHTSVDCFDAPALSLWWQEVLGYEQDPANPNLPGDPECLIVSPDNGHKLLFIQVPEAKSVKNRIHFDLRPDAQTRDEELRRLLGLGAVQVDDLRQGDGTGWVVLADPEDNEFCILRSEAEVATGPAYARSGDSVAPPSD